MGHRGYGVAALWLPVLIVAAETWRLTAGFTGAGGFAASVADPTPLRTAGIALLVLGALVLAAASNRSTSALGRSPAGRYRTEGSLRLQRWAGRGMWGLILFHVGLLVFCVWKLDSGATGQYEFLRNSLSMPAISLIYVFGLGATGLFASQEMAALLRAGAGSRGTALDGWFEGVASVAALGLFVLAINVLSHYATGRAIWFTDHGPTVTEEATP